MMRTIGRKGGSPQSGSVSRVWQAFYRFPLFGYVIEYPY
jgi:hypothetical protein